mmetsp:Transcript_12996/g.40019  ORF Transcript_12996/g.40019 Transcript_12996/m.40019 type:complete len:122 (+) Transcript_12996:120-485(+)
MGFLGAQPVYAQTFYTSCELILTPASGPATSTKPERTEWLRGWLLTQAEKFTAVPVAGGEKMSETCCGDGDELRQSCQWSANTVGAPSVRPSEQTVAAGGYAQAAEESLVLLQCSTSKLRQ